MAEGFGNYGWGSPMAEWEASQGWGRAGSPYDWRSGGFDPNNPFGTTMYNQGGDAFQITPEMMHWREMEGVRNQWDLTNLGNRELAASGWVSPGNFRNFMIGGSPVISRNASGDLTFNPGAFSGMFGGGGGGYGAGAGEAYGEWEGGPVGVPDPYSESAYVPTTVDPAAAIAAAQPAIQEKMENAFADAGNRLGQSGFAMSTPYTGEAGLGGAARRAASDLAEIESRYTYDASKFNSAQEAAAYQAQKQREAMAWGQHGNWQQNAALADQANQFGAWLQGGNWNQADLDRQLQYDMMNQNQGNMEQQMMMALMGQFMGGF